MSDRAFRIALLAGAAGSLVLLAAIAARLAIIGSVEGRAVYGYVQPFTAPALIVGLLAACTAGAALALPSPAPGRREWIAVAFWLAVALALQAFIRTLTLFPFETIFVSDGANSFYTVAGRHSPVDVLGHYSAIQRDAPLHAQSNMPGKILLLQALALVSDRSDVFPWLLVVLSDAGGVLMYLFVRELFADRTVALYSLVLYLFVPARLVFLPLMNTVTPAFALACLCVLLWWLRTNRAGIAALLGLTLYGMVLFEPLPLVLGPVFVALAARAILRGEISRRAFVLQSCVAVLVFVATAEAVLLVWGFDLVRTFERLAAHAAEFNSMAERPYGVWLWANLWEFAIGAGPCQLVLFAAAILASLRNSAPAADRFTRPLATLGLGLLVSLMATDAIGINRGEVVRLWIFLACLFQIPAAWVCAQLKHPAAIATVAGCSILLGAIGTSMVGFIIP